MFSRKIVLEVLGFYRNNQIASIAPIVMYRNFLYINLSSGIIMSLLSYILNVTSLFSFSNSLKCSSDIFAALDIESAFTIILPTNEQGKS